MGLVPLYDGSGNVMTDSGGNIIYLNYEGPTAERYVEVDAEVRFVEVDDEVRFVEVEAD